MNDNRRIRRLVKVLVILALVSGAAGAVVQWAIPDQPWCKVTGSWASRLSAQQLPSNLEEFRQIPKTYRTAVFAILSPSVRSRIMRETWTLALTAREWTPEQAAFIKDGIARMTPEFYAQADAVLAIAKEKAARGDTSPATDAYTLSSAERTTRAKQLFPTPEEYAPLVPATLSQTFPGKTTAVLLPTLRQFVLMIRAMTPDVSAVGWACGCRSADPNGPDCFFCQTIFPACMCRSEMSICEMSGGCGSEMNLPCDRVCWWGTDEQ
jgi:hypothetical protein